MELYNGTNMSLSNNPERRRVQEKLLKGEELSFKEKLTIGGHDNPLTTIGSYNCKPDCCYRAISLETYEIYKKQGFVGGGNSNEYLGLVKDANGNYREDNGGVDWYLGGFGPRYGKDGSAQIIIECPAYKEYFTPAADNGCSLCSNPTIRQMKSSGQKNPIPMNLVTNVFNYSKIRKEQQERFEELRKQDMQRKAIEREQQLTSIVNNEIESNIEGKTL